MTRIVRTKNMYDGIERKDNSETLILIPPAISDPKDSSSNTDKNTDTHTDSDSDQDKIKPRTPRRANLKYLDSVRGFSALFVVIHHINQAFFEPGLDALDVAFYGTSNKVLSETTKVWLQNFGLWNYVCFGTLHVSVFFVLSARVLPIGYLATKNNKKMASNLLKRPLRLIAPIVMLQAILFLIKILIPAKVYENYETITRLTFMKQDFVAMIEALSGFPWVHYNIARFSFSGTYSGNILWTLPRECFYSYYVYSLAFVIANVQKPLAIITLTILSIHTTYFMKEYIHFYIGFVFCVIHHYNGFESLLSSNTRMTNFFRLSMITITGTILFSTYLLPFINAIGKIILFFKIDRILGDVPEGFPPLYLAMMTLSLFFCLETIPLIQSILSYSPLVFLGRISLGIYVCHVPVLPLLRYFFAEARSLYPVPANIDWTVLILSLIYIVLVLPVAYLFTVLVDEPLVAFISRQIDWLISQPDFEKMTPSIFSSSTVYVEVPRN